MRYLLFCYLISASLSICAQSNNANTAFSKKRNCPTNAVKETWYEKELRIDAELRAKRRQKKTIVVNDVQVKEPSQRVEPREDLSGNYVIFKDGTRGRKKVVGKKKRK